MKKKNIIRIIVLIVVVILAAICISVLAYIKENRKNPNIRYFDGETTVDDIEWMGVAGDGVSTCIVKFGEQPHEFVVPGQYIICNSGKGTAERIRWDLSERYIYDRYELYAYDIQTREKRLLLDLVDCMDEVHEMQLTSSEGCWLIDGQAVYLSIIETCPNETIAEEEIDYDYISVNVTDGSYRILEELPQYWYDYRVGILSRLEGKRLLQNNLPEGQLTEIRMKYFGWQISSYHNFEGVYKIQALAKFLPEQNEALYGMFPELEQYRGEEDCYVCLYIGGYPTAEELLRLFMEDGQEISFEGVVMSGEYSIDGEEHEIHSFEEYEQWRARE